MQVKMAENSRIAACVIAIAIVLKKKRNAKRCHQIWVKQWLIKREELCAIS